jgi:hypothetical protein
MEKSGNTPHRLIASGLLFDFGALVQVRPADRDYGDDLCGGAAIGHRLALYQV